MSESVTRTLTVSYDGESWVAMDADGNYMTLADEGVLNLPELPDGSLANKLLLPAEFLLSRAFSLPLSNPRFIDQDVLAQELEEHTAEDAEDWWLAWRAGQDENENGVSGLMFGLPEAVRGQIDGHEAWQQLQTLSVDSWARLQAQLNTGSDDKPDVSVQEEGNTAVFDVDASGVFFGVWHGRQGNSSDGYWRGMRRLNWAVEALSGEQWTALAENIKRSLQSMGCRNEDAQHGETISNAIGRLPPELHAALNLPLWQGALVELTELSSRNHANLATELATSLNFRHGRWRSQSGFGQLKPWYRSLAIAAGLVVVWALGMMWQNHHLETQLAAAQQHVIESFHQGLPNEKVMIDALAQLRKAAGGARGGAASGQGRNSAAAWLGQVAGVQRAYQKIPWKIKLLSLEHGKIMMSGRVKDLQTMNNIRKALQQEAGMPVKVLDTDISGQQVQFRMAW